MSESAQDYKIKLKAFEGPMELLMHLIEKNKIDIYDIPVAELTEQYLAYLESMRSLDMEIASDFLVMAAKLLLIKSRMILPQVKTADSEEEEEDPREELVRRIVEYKRFKQAGSFLDGLAQVQQDIFAREPLKQAVSHLPPEHIAPEQLLKVMLAMITVKPEPVLPVAIVEVEHFNLQTQMEFVLQALAAIQAGLCFVDLLRVGSREEYAVNFLAILELVHSRAILVNQSVNFGEINLMLRQAEPDVIGER